MKNTSIAVGMLALLAGCDNQGLSGTGTGVVGLDTPAQILSNPYVAEAIDEARQSGLDVEPQTGVSPPVISGRYSISGWRRFPGNVQIGGTWTWSNQTSDNHIDTDYSDLGGQEGSGVQGEIIRGIGSRFTVYGVLTVSQFGCTETVVYLIDGVQEANGDVTAVYVGAPADTPQCFTPSGGEMDLELEGAAKLIADSHATSLMATLLSASE